MTDEGEPFNLSRAVAAQTLALAAPHRQFSQAQIEGVTLWLEKARRRAVTRLGATPLKMDDVDRLEAAYLHFHNIVAELKDCDDPPPLLPMLEDGMTTWESWIAVNKTFGFPQGRRPSSDWQLIAALLALYETVSGNPPSGAQWDGPTMKFLQKAMALLAEGKHKFTLPSADALRKQLPKLRQSYLTWEKRTLSEIISKPGE